MKNVNISLVVVALFGTLIYLSCQSAPKNPNVFTVEGEIKGLTSDLYFQHPERNYNRGSVDTIKVVNGKFHYTDSIVDMDLIRIFAGDVEALYKRPKGSQGYSPYKSMNLMLVASPGANIKIEGEILDFMNAYPSGDEQNEALAKINKLLYPKLNELGNLTVKMSYEENAELRQKMAEEYKTKERETWEALSSHLENNQNSYAALWYLNDMMTRSQISDDEAIDIFRSATVDLKDTKVYQAIDTRIAGIEATQEGKPVPEISTTSTLTGELFEINTLKGKYVLIDFWGTWCGPCVSEMPAVKAFQDKYQDKVVVLGINSGDRKETVKKFVERYDYSWPQVLSVKDNSSDNFVDRFYVKEFPTKIVLNPDGIIIKRFVGSSESVFDFLESEFGNKVGKL